MGKKKIINDPIYGLISFPYEILYRIMDHPLFQRLRRISQMGLSHLVYPGATHTRFHHALGALHLMTETIETLRWKGIEITEVEAEAVSIAILLHDIGHGPFSHALERIFIPIDHEELSLAMMNFLNSEMDGNLDLAIRIFKNEYHKPFLHQLISGQLDMDRMDYLIRDSYYTGVAEGVIGYDRIIKMLNVVDHQLVVEEKGIYSIEKFLMARRLMYLQVYLHKTSIVAEQMLKKFIHYYLEETQDSIFLNLKNRWKSIQQLDDELLLMYADLEDVDILQILKRSKRSKNAVLRLYAHSLLNRNLFKIYLQETPFDPIRIADIQQEIKLSFPDEVLQNHVLITGMESNLAYRVDSKEILILKKTGEIIPFAKVSSFPQIGMRSNFYFIAHPKVSN